ncbi:hypothetical protein PJP13_24170 [Mycobacterium kansasii]
MGNQKTQELRDYIVEVPGRGYTRGFLHPDLGEIKDTPSGEILDEKTFGTRAEVDKIAERIRNQYKCMGCPDIAGTVRVVERTVRVEYSEWQPVE